MRIGILTSSRADFGIYLPLLKKLQQDPFFDVSIIAFGTHLSPFHGYTIQNIIDENLTVAYKIESLVLGDSQEAVATAMGLTSIKFASFWSTSRRNFDLVFCLGDRYEMFSAVTAGIPFNINFAHLHGGEETAGAIDDIFRHCISLSSMLHFCATSAYQHRIQQLLNKHGNVYNVGALSLDNLFNMELYSKDEFFEQWKIDLSKPTVLVTLHPETKSSKENVAYAKILSSVIIRECASYQIVITMPNADSFGNTIREVFKNQLARNSSVVMIENFGTKSYFSCMKHSAFLMGNTSSGIIEAASLGKYVINLGKRQEGRARSKNVFDVPFEESDILNCIRKIESLPEYDKENIYWQGGASDKVIDVLKNVHGRL